VVTSLRRAAGSRAVCGGIGKASGMASLHLADALRLASAKKPVQRAERAKIALFFYNSNRTT